MSIFYDVYNKSPDVQKEIFKEAKANCYMWQHDILDCTKSFSRQNVVTSTVRTNEDTFDEVMSHFDSGCHTVFIDRQGYGPINKRECWEIGFCTIGPGIDHFLFIHVDPVVAHDLIRKYELKMVTYE